MQLYVFSDEDMSLRNASDGIIHWGPVHQTPPSFPLASSAPSPAVGEGSRILQLNSHKSWRSSGNDSLRTSYYIRSLLRLADKRVALFFHSLRRLNKFSNAQTTLERGNKNDLFFQADLFTFISSCTESAEVFQMTPVTWWRSDHRKVITWIRNRIDNLKKYTSTSLTIQQPFKFSLRCL